MIHHIDCLEFMRGMVERGDRVNAIITDPPYLYLNHKLDRKFNEREFFGLASNLTDKIVFFGRGDSFYKWNLLCAEFGFEFKEEIVWDKKQLSNPMGNIGRIHETISIRMKKRNTLKRVKSDYIDYVRNLGDLEKVFNDFKRVVGARKSKPLQNFIRTGEKFFTKRKTKHCITCSSKTRDIDRVVKTITTIEEGIITHSIIRQVREHRSMEHPTQKPINLLRKLVLLISDKGDTIFDPFMGSGSTGVASLIEGRKFVGCEIDDEYFQIAKRRVEETDKTLRQSLFYGID